MVFLSNKNSMKEMQSPPIHKNSLPLPPINKSSSSMRKHLIKLGKWTLLILFIGYYVSSTMFYHTHHFSWGTVTHSHPYVPSDCEVPSHTHTPSQCLAISFLTNLLLIASVFAVFICKTVIIQKIYIKIRRYKSIFKYVFSPLRAPPVFICQ